MIVKVIAVTRFLGVPEELTDEGIKPTQDQGSDIARLIECGGRTCYDSYGIGRDSAKYHDHIKEVGHGSVTEHGSISFYIDGVSRGLTHELVRHRHSNISQRSTRYVDESESNWALHPLITKYADRLNMNSIKATIELCKQEYKMVADALEHALIEDGIDKVNARKQARGAARGLLGNALTSALVWTCNIRSLRNFFEQRCSQFADAEIRLCANKIFEAALAICPEFFNDYERVECPDKIGFGVITKNRKI
jgi:thymidylate synthase (FAD)